MALYVYNSAAFSTASGVAVAGGATVSVRLESSGALAALYSNRDSAGSPAMANPFTADSFGRFTFYVAPTDQGYSVRVQFGAEDYTVHNVLDLQPFTQTGTGAETTTVQDELRRIIYPEQFGALGDGSTDDSLDFQNAATAAVGKILKLTPGKTYVIAAVNIGAGTTVDMTGATVKLKVLGTNVSSPIFIVTASKVTFIGGDIDGQKSSQPADGFSDSFSGGTQGQGRAFRAGIKADGNGITDLTIRGVRFLNVYGACVAARDIQVVRVQDCKAKTCNFELAYLYFNTGSPATRGTDAIVTGNVIDTAASGDGSINANGILITNYRRANISANTSYNDERNFLKVEGGTDITVSNNVCDTNTKDNFPAIQIAADAYDPSRVVVVNNAIYNSNVGIQITDAGSSAVIIANNSIHTTTGSSTADGISVDSGNDVIISHNNLYNIKRAGILVQGSIVRLSIQGNNAYGQGNSYALLLSCTGGSWSHVLVQGNLFHNFASSPASDGMVYFNRSAASPEFYIYNFICQGNLILAGGSSNRGLRTGIDMFVTGIVSDNYVDGEIEFPTGGAMRYRNNTSTGAQNFISGIANVEEKGATQTTVGGAGGASALPGTPTGYHEVIINGTARVVPFYAKS